MVKPVQVGRRYDDPTLVIPAAVAVAGAVVGGLLWSGGNAMPWLLGAGVAAVVAGGAAVRVARGRRTVEPSADGFVVRDRHGELAFHDDQVTAVGLGTKINLSNGTPKGVTRTARVVVREGDAEGVIPMRYTHNLKRTDPLGGLFDRLLGRVHERATADLAAGRGLAGDGWAVEADGFHHLTTGGWDVVPFARVAAVDVFDEKVCVWEAGNPEAVFRARADGVNCLVLVPVLRAKAETQGGGKGESADGLGRLLFERSKGTAAGLAWTLTAVFVPVAGYGLVLIAEGVTGKESSQMLIGLGVVAAAVGIVLSGWLTRVNVFRCHSRGVCRETTLGGRKEMLYSEVAGFSYQGVRRFVNGVYAGTTVTMTFVPREGGKKAHITYRVEGKGNDQEMDNLREFIADVIARNHYSLVKSGGAVEWTPGVWLRPTGLHLPARRRAAPVVLPYSGIKRFDMTDGVLYVYDDRGKELFRLTVSEPNFFPGWNALTALVADAAAEKQQDAQ